MSIDLEYAIKKDVRNNPVVREVDERQRAEYRRTVWIASAIVLMVLFATWQHLRVIDGGYQTVQLRALLDSELRANRLLRLEMEQLSAPQTIEERAVGELRMVEPSESDVLFLDVVRASKPGKTVVAAAGEVR